MLMVTERVVERLVAMDEAIDVVEDAFARLYRGEAEVFPVVAGRLGRLQGRHLLAREQAAELGRPRLNHLSSG
jgi:hypothetical protein